MNALTVRLFTYANPRDVLAFVTLPGETEVRVRFHRSDITDQWRCDMCGRHRFSTCPHERAAVTQWRTERHPEPFNQGAQSATA